MDKKKEDHLGSSIFIVFLAFTFIVIFFSSPCDARMFKQTEKNHPISHPASSMVRRLDIVTRGDSIMTAAAPVPFSDDLILGDVTPISINDDNSPPYCIYPPFVPLPPYTIPPSPNMYMPPPSPPTYGTPILPIQTPPPFTIIPNPPEYNFPNPPEYNFPNPPEYTPSPPVSIPSPPETVPNPPETVPSPPESIPSPPERIPSPPETVPSPPESIPSPPESIPSPPESVPSPPESIPSPPESIPSPPESIPSPPESIPSPPEAIPSPPVFQTPIVYPPPMVPPPRSGGGGMTLWCVAKPSVPDPIIQEAMNYACGSGADCELIQPDGSCYEPNTLLSHASFAFNSYWQRTKAAGGTCDFGGTATLVTVDPSFDGCHFLYN